MLVELRAFIIADPVVQSLIGTRMYPVTLPQKPTLPAVSYQVVGTTRSPVMQHDDEMPMTRVQINCWSLSAATADAVDEAIRQLFHDYQRQEIGGSPGVLVAGVFVDGYLTDFEPDTLLYRVSRD